MRGRIVSREALGDETIYVVEAEAGLLHVRIPPTARFAEEQVVTVRHRARRRRRTTRTTEQVVSR